MDLNGRRILAFGTSGAQGSGLEDAIRAQGAIPVRATSRPERAAQWQAEGIDAVQADLADPGAVTAAAALAEVVAVAGHLPLSMGPAAAKAVGSYIALRAMGLPVTVNTGAPYPPDGAPDPFGTRALVGALLDAGVTVITPTAYLENLAAPWSTSRLDTGILVYPRPAQDVVAWIAASDMGRAAVATLASDLTGLLPLAGPQALTFEQLAEEVGGGLDTELTFVRVTPTEFGDMMRPFMGDGPADGVAAGYASMPEEPNPGLNPPQAAESWRALGVTPLGAREWAREVLLPIRLAQSSASATGR